MGELQTYQGFPENAMDKGDALRVLGLFEDDEPGIIRKKYRKLIRKYHPDITGRIYFSGRKASEEGSWI